MQTRARRSTRQLKKRACAPVDFTSWHSLEEEEEEEIIFTRKKRRKPTDDNWEPNASSLEDSQSVEEEEEEEEEEETEPKSQYILAVTKTLRERGVRATEEGTSVKKMAREWVFTPDHEYSNAMGRAVHQCALCGHRPIRFRFILVNKLDQMRRIEPVGSKCITMMGRWGADTWILDRGLSVDYIDWFVAHMKSQAKEVDSAVRAMTRC